MVDNDNIIIQTLNSHGVVVRASKVADLATTQTELLAIRNNYNYCLCCKNSFETVQAFNKHMGDTQKKPIYCSLCQASFTRQDHLKRHMECLHPSVRFCQCPACHQHFDRPEVLDKHVTESHKNEQFKCRECVEEFNCYKDLSQHELIHNTTRYTCPHCSSRFKRKDHMQRHITTTHLNQTVSCPVCSQVYKRKDHMVQHIRVKHRMAYINGELFTSNDL